jgi:hypothetical protein
MMMSRTAYFAAAGDLGGARSDPYLFSKFRWLWSDHASFGELDRDPEVDFGKHAVEAVVTRTILEIGGHGFQAEQRALVEGTGQKTELELIKRIECAAAVLYRAAAPLGGPLDSLQRDQSVDPTERT